MELPFEKGDRMIDNLEYWVLFAHKLMRKEGLNIETAVQKVQMLDEFKDSIISSAQLKESLIEKNRLEREQIFSRLKSNFK